ncbi:MAG: hypothetical protein DRO39_02190 [Thermoprotei archaeon]|nr:MAG: hypothetical protein DRO39_02190 [Thermoprotei archaeon]
MGAVSAYIARRALMTFVTFLVIISVYFIVVRVIPVMLAGGNPEADPVIAALRRTQEDPRFSNWIDYTIKRFGLDKPLIPDQYLIYLKNILTFEFGVSIYTQKPVVSEILNRLPYTLVLYSGAMILPIIIGYYTGLATIRHRGGKLDAIMTSIGIISYIVPSWLILLLIYYFLAYLPKLYWGTPIFPLPVKAPSITEINWETIKYLLWYIAPLLTAAVLAWFGSWTYFFRQIAMSELGKDYVYTARAKGLSEMHVIKEHILPNLKPPIIMRLAFWLPGIFGGALIFEIISNWPGIAYFSYAAFLNFDYPVMTAFFAISSLLLLVSIFIADVLIAIIDPRVALQQR